MFALAPCHDSQQSVSALALAPALHDSQQSVFALALAPVLAFAEIYALACDVSYAFAFDVGPTNDLQLDNVTIQTANVKTMSMPLHGLSVLRSHSSAMLDKNALICRAIHLKYP